MAVLGVPSPVSTGMARRVLGNDASIVLVASFSIHLLTIVLSCLAYSTGGFGWRGMSSDVGRVSRNRGRKWGFDCDNIGCGDSALAIETMVSSGGGIVVLQ